MDQAPGRPYARRAPARRLDAPTRPHRPARMAQSRAGTASSLPVLLKALWRDRQVRFLYEALLHETGERTVDPLGLVARGSTWYLIATRNVELRTYRVSRMRDAETLETCEPTGGFRDFRILGTFLDRISRETAAILRRLSGKAVRHAVDPLSRMATRFSSSA